MHTCWMLLAASGEFPAHILNVRPPRFVSKDRPLVFEWVREKFYEAVHVLSWADDLS